MNSSTYFVNNDSTIIPLSFIDITSIFSKIVTGKIFGIKRYSNRPSNVMFGRNPFKNTISCVINNSFSAKSLYYITYRKRLYYITSGYIEDAEYHPLVFIGCPKEDLILNDTTVNIFKYRSSLYNTVYITEYLFNKENSGLLKLLQKTGFNLTRTSHIDFSSSIKLSYSEADSLFIKPSLNTDRDILINKSLKSMDAVLLNMSNFEQFSFYINIAGYGSDSTYTNFKTTPAKDIKMVMSDYAQANLGFFNCDLFPWTDDFVR